MPRAPAAFPGAPGPPGPGHGAEQTCGPAGGHTSWTQRGAQGRGRARTGWPSRFLGKDSPGETRWTTRGAAGGEAHGRVLIRSYALFWDVTGPLAYRRLIEDSGCRTQGGQRTHEVPHARHSIRLGLAGILSQEEKLGWICASVPAGALVLGL